MSPGYPLHLHPVLVPAARASPAGPPKVAATGGWRYPSGRRSRGALALSLLLSAIGHAVVLGGIGRTPKKVAVRPVEVPTIALTMMPQLQELEEVMPGDDRTETADTAVLVPAQPDVPTVARPSDFVQMIDLSTLQPRPDLAQAKIFVIPENIRRGGKISDKIGIIFNLADLDRHPEPVVQPAPIYPIALKREAETATVRVEFIVDTKGAVLNPVVVDTTHPGFNEAAMAGVSKWKFRPGIRNGRKVNTRMQVPIIFRVAERVD